MPILTARSRHDVEVRSFPLIVSFAIPLVAIGIQAYFPKLFPRFGIMDLPLIVTVYFAIARRNPIHGTLIGALIGIMEDALTQRPIGINGIAKSLIGFCAASIGVRVDVDSHGTRLLLNFLFSLLSSALYAVILQHLLGLGFTWSWVYELIKAAVNAVVAVILFALLDRTRLQGD
jgi:rod shape-determining protein MreD